MATFTTTKRFTMRALECSSDTFPLNRTYPILYDSVLNWL